MSSSNSTTETFVEFEQRFAYFTLLNNAVRPNFSQVLVRLLELNASYTLQIVTSDANAMCHLVLPVPCVKAWNEGKCCCVNMLRGPSHNLKFVEMVKAFVDRRTFPGQRRRAWLDL